MILGHAGNDSISAGGGDDTIDGGVGADTMTGGTGNDTYHVDNPGDVVIEAAGGGIDTVIVRGNWQIADNVENVVLEGAGSTLTGNAGANRIEGDAADDVIDGGAGDDLEIGGDGDDVLVSASGHDSLVGGAGDDIYRIHGGSAHIEDFQGHNTIDASEATGNSRIDLSGASETEIELEATDLGIGGTVTGALDIQFLQDLTGSFSDDIDNVRQLVPQIVTALQTVQSGARFGVSTFRDKPMDPFGGIADSLGDPDWVYATDQYLGTSASALSTAYAGFLADGGNDEPEAQLEALLQLGLRANSEVGFKANAARFVVLFTDATFHTADDGLAAGLTTPNNGDTVLDGNGIGENYPLISQVRAVLEAANIIPIFAVTSDVEATYQPLVTALGRGTVVTLSADSANIVGAITSGLQSATTTQIADAIGGNGNDTLIGNGGNNTLTGNGGDDLFEGRAGNDRIVGNAGLDTAIYAGILAEYAVTWNLDGSLVLADTLAGRDGNDTLAGVEQARFGTSRYAIDYAAHTITAMSVPAAPATGVYLESNGHVSLSSTALQVFGTPGQEAVTLLAGAAGVTVDQNIDTIFLPGTVAGYFFQQTGNRLNVFSGSELLLRMTVQSDADGTLLSFADGMASAAIQGGVMQLGGAPVSSTAATALAPALAPPGAAPTAGPSAQVFLASDAHFAAAVSGMRIFGGAGSSEMLAIQPGASGLLADQAVDIVSFADTASSYAFQQSGNRLAVFDAAGATQMISIPVQTDADGTQLIFAGQSYHAAFSSGVLHIGSLTIGTTPAPLAFPAVADTPGTFG